MKYLYLLQQALIWLITIYWAYQIVVSFCSLIKLKDKKYRNQKNLFIIEGRHSVLEDYKAGLIEELILEQDELFPLGVPTTYVSKEIIYKLSDTVNRQKRKTRIQKRKQYPVFFSPYFDNLN